MSTDVDNARGKDPPATEEIDKVRELLATVIDVVHGKHGLYAVTASSFGGKDIYITFSLKEGVLEEYIPMTPEVLQQLPGTSVFLSNIVSKIVKVREIVDGEVVVKKKRVWRALHARFYKPSDEKVFASEKGSQSIQDTNERRSENGH